MNRPLLEFTSSLLSPVVVERIGWVLVHSLWQFAVIALLAFFLDRLLKRRTAALRYATLLVGLMLMVATPVVTCMLMPEAIDPSAMSLVEAHRTSPDELQPDATLTDETLPALTPPTVEPNLGNSLASAGTAAIMVAGTAPEPESWHSRVVNGVAPWLGTIVGVWCCGVVLCSLRPLVRWSVGSMCID